jgi:hypothetical protein
VLTRARTSPRLLGQWAVGCILGEMLGRKPLFQGKDYLSQLTLIVEVLGSPTEDDLESISSPHAAKLLRDLPHCPGKPWAELFPDAPPLVRPPPLLAAARLRGTCV